MEGRDIHFSLPILRRYWLECLWDLLTPEAAWSMAVPAPTHWFQEGVWGLTVARIAELCGWPLSSCLQFPKDGTSNGRSNSGRYLWFRSCRGWLGFPLGFPEKMGCETSLPFFHVVEHLKKPPTFLTSFSLWNFPISGSRQQNPYFGSVTRRLTSNAYENKKSTSSEDKFM